MYIQHSTLIDIIQGQLCVLKKFSHNCIFQPIYMNKVCLNHVNGKFYMKYHSQPTWETRCYAFEHEHKEASPLPDIIWGTGKY
jgi:hypothetical protein